MSEILQNLQASWILLGNTFCEEQLVRFMFLFQSILNYTYLFIELNNLCIQIVRTTRSCTFLLQFIAYIDFKQSETNIYIYIILGYINLTKPIKNNIYNCDAINQLLCNFDNGLIAPQAKYLYLLLRNIIVTS